MRKSKVSRIRRLLAWAAGIFLAFVITIWALVEGVIPLSGRNQVVDLFGAAPAGLILEYSTGWEDHTTFLRFRAESEWVAKAAGYAGLSSRGIVDRESCLGAPSSPWWMRVRPSQPGQCWERIHRYGGSTLLHYSEESGYVYVYDYST